MNVESKIKQIVQRLKIKVDYKYMNWAQANVALDAITGPTIIYVLPASGKLDFSWYQIKDCPDTFIAFVTPSDFDFDGDVNNDAVEEMKRLAIIFIEAVNSSGYFEQIEGELNYSVLYDYLDQNVTGVIINPSLKEIEGESACAIRDSNSTRV